ncbi:MAG: ABC transporter permease [Anaerocolumna sp.]
MAFQLYKTRIKCLCRGYETIFWSFGFPLLLAMFFYLGFNNLGGSNSIDTIPVAIVTGGSTESNFINALKSAQITEDKKLFKVQSQTLNVAGLMLQNDKIAGYIVYNKAPVLYIKNGGIEQSVIKSFVDNYLQMSHTTVNITALNPDLVNNIAKITAKYKGYIVEGGDKDRNPDYTLIYFYSLIALTCMFGTNWGFREMVDIQANQSSIAARINVSPIHKMKLLFCNLLAAFTIHYISILFLLTFLNKVLRVDLGHRPGMILLTCMFGSFCGIALGAMICVVVKANVKVRGSILNVVLMGGAFLSGMMIVDIKYIIASKAPIIGYLNPSSLITDAFYCLYYYDSYGRLFQDLFMLGILTFIFSVITYFEIRRREYASI